MSKKKEPAHHEEEAGEAWLLPYSDLMTLLLAVFIVLFAVSKVDEAKAKAISSEFTESMMTEAYAEAVASEAAAAAAGQGSQGEGSLSTEKVSALEEFLGQYELQKLEDLKSELDTKLQSEGMSSSVSTSIDMRGLVIRLNNAIMFDSGSAEIKSEHEGSLIEIAAMINSLDNYIRIEGHTDNVPITSEIYPSNWELSSARAASVVQLFINKCSFLPNKLVAVGYGEYKPVEDNSTAEGREKNRRIDIIILSEKYNNLEEQLTE